MKSKYANNLIEDSLFTRMKGGAKKVGLVALVGTMISVGAYGCKESKDYYDRGVVRLEKREHDAAISDFTEVTKIAPELAVAYSERALIYYIKKEYDKVWENIHKQESLGLEARPGFLKALREASGRIK